MKSAPSSRWFHIGPGRFLSAIALLLIPAAGLSAAQPGTLTWIGSGDADSPGSGNWNAAASWSENAVPIIGTSGTRSYVFGGSGDTAYTATDNISASLTGADSGKMIYQSLILQSTASVAETIAGGNITFSYTGPTIQQNGSGDFNITSNYVFAVTTTFTGTGTGTVTLSGIAGGSGSDTSGGALTINTTNAAATLRLASNSSAQLLGNITLTNGTLDFTAANALNSRGNVSLTINGGTLLSSNGSTAANGSSASAGGSRTMQINGAFTLGGTQDWGTGTMAVNLNADVAITANAGGTTGTTLGGVVADGTDGSKLTLAAGSTGTVTLTADNTYTGGTFVNGGALGTGSTGTFGTGDVTVDTGARLILGNSASIADTATLAFGNSTIELSYTGTETVGALYDSITGTYIATGTYTADQLNALANADVFSGEGSLLVSAIPEPAAVALLCGVGALAAAALRRRRA